MEEAKWYVAHTFSGYENKVASNIQTVVENRNLHDLIHEVAIPTETVKELKSDGTEKEYHRKLMPGSVWNTMPAHTHTRRMEAYFYFNVAEGNAICHLMGEPQQERLIWLHNEQAVTSPEWSIHAAAGTRNYTFIWGMAGENLNYADKDEIRYIDMR